MIAPNPSQSSPLERQASTEPGTPSPTICHCHGITEKEILDSVENHHAPTVDAVSRATGACTGCTGCHCRIERLINGKPAACSSFALCQACGCCLAICGCLEDLEDEGEETAESVSPEPVGESPSRASTRW